MSKDQKRGNREAKKPKAIKPAVSGPAAIQVITGSASSSKTKH
jgi:hypothetical protein